MRWGISFLSTRERVRRVLASYPRGSDLRHTEPIAPVRTGGSRGNNGMQIHRTRLTKAAGMELPRHRLARLLGREALLPSDWQPGATLPRAAVWRLLQMVRQERARHCCGHWTASLPRLLALEATLPAAFRSRAGPGRGSADNGIAPQVRPGSGDGSATANKKDRPVFGGGPDPC